MKSSYTKTRESRNGLSYRLRITRVLKILSNNIIFYGTVVNGLMHHHHHHIRLFEVVKRNRRRQHTVQKIDVRVYMDIHTIHTD